MEARETYESVGGFAAHPVSSAAAGGRNADRSWCSCIEGVVIHNELLWQQPDVDKHDPFQHPFTFSFQAALLEGVSRSR